MKTVYSYKFCFANLLLTSSLSVSICVAEGAREYKELPDSLLTDDVVYEYTFKALGQ